MSDPNPSIDDPSIAEHELTSSDYEFSLVVEAGTIIDERYEIVGLLGEGGMAAVYDAKHLNLDRHVAIKMLHDQRLSDEQMRRRFDREARTLASVDHPNIVGISDYGFWHDVPYLVMERLEGRTLYSLLREGPLAPKRVVNLMLQLLNALQHAHGRKLVHRDLKPGNVWLEAGVEGRERLRLLDFGFAKFVDGRGDLTGEGIVMGTPAYMAPEQAAAGSVDHRTDIYAAGVIMFEMLAGRRPFEGGAGAVIRAHLHKEPPAIVMLRPSLHAAWSAVVSRPLMKSPEDRYQRATDFAKELLLLPAEAVSPKEGRAPETSDDIALPVSSPPEPLAAPRFGMRRGVLVAVAAVLALGWMLRPTAPTSVDPVDPPAQADPVEQAAQSAPIEVPPEAPALEPRFLDPWTNLAPEPILDALRARVAAGQPLTEADKHALRTFERDTPDDPRPGLLRARDAVVKRWFSVAVEAYRGLYQDVPASRGAPEMIDDLLLLTRSHSEPVSSSASALVQFGYGAEAMAAIERALEDADDPKLRELRALINRSP